MAKSGTRLQNKVKPGQRARKGKRCPVCNRNMKVGVKPSCQFHKKESE